MTKQNVSGPKSGVNPAMFATAVTKAPLLGSCINDITSKSTFVEMTGGPRIIKSWVDSMRASSPTHDYMSTTLYEDRTSWMVSTIILPHNQIICHHFKKKKTN